MGYRLLLVGLAFTLAACAALDQERVEPLRPPTPELLPLPTATPRPAAIVVRPVPTPVIIASPATTATPVTHVVQSGETLIGIAVKYGVSLEALQAANENVSPRFLSIGAVLFIPTPEAGTVPDPSGPPAFTPAPVVVGDPACYLLPTGALYCLAEARNPGGTALENISARITLAGADGLPLASAVAYSALDMIPVGAAAPLAALFPSAPAELAATGIEVLTADSAGPVAGTVPLDMLNHHGAATGFQWTVTGQLRNASGRPAPSAWVTLTLYDSAGAILGYRKQSLANGLAVDETRVFSITATSLGGAAARYGIAAEGRP